MVPTGCSFIAKKWAAIPENEIDIYLNKGEIKNPTASLLLQDIATMQLCANKLDKKDFFGKSDPFLVFYRSNEDGTWVGRLDSSGHPCL